jgi:hypothetical protein
MGQHHLRQQYNLHSPPLLPVAHSPLIPVMTCLTRLWPIALAKSTATFDW